MQTSKPLQAIRMYDPALDRSRVTAETILRYARERDPALLAFLPGQVPVRFHLRRISRRLWDWVEQGYNDSDKQTRAFRASVIRVENLPVSGGRIDWAPAATKDNGGFDIAMTETELEKFAFADVYEIGSVAWHSSFFPLDCVATYPVPPSSVLVWDQTLVSSQHADASQSDAVPSNSEPSAHQAEPTPEPVQPEPSSDALTAATVPAIASSDAST